MKQGVVEGGAEKGIPGKKQTQRGRAICSVKSLK